MAVHLRRHQRPLEPSYVSQRPSVAVFVLGNSGDRRLQEIHHKTAGGTTLSRFEYVYSPAGRVTTWTQQDGTQTRAYDFTYDDAAQLVSAVYRTTDPTPSILTKYSYTYDRAGNRSGAEVDDAPTSSSYDGMNRLTSHATGGALTFEGILSEPSSVVVQGKPAKVDANNRFVGSANVTGGVNNVTVTATDPNGNVTANIYQVEVGSANGVVTHDQDGNITGDANRSFEWNAENELMAVVVGNGRTEFTYDGLQRRVRAVHKLNGIVQSDRRVVWCGFEMCEERAADGETVTRTVLARGEIVGGEAHFFAGDHLGNVRYCY